MHLPVLPSSDSVNNSCEIGISNSVSQETSSLKQNVNKYKFHDMVSHNNRWNEIRNPTALLPPCKYVILYGE